MASKTGELLKQKQAVTVGLLHKGRVAESLNKCAASSICGQRRVEAGRLQGHQGLESTPFTTGEKKNESHGPCH